MQRRDGSLGWRNGIVGSTDVVARCSVLLGRSVGEAKLIGRTDDSK